MDVLDRLERLVRLREAGALTEAEFRAAKAQLLGGAPAPAPPAGFAPEEGPGRPVWPWLAGAAALLLLVLAVGLLVGRNVGEAAATNYQAAADGAAADGAAVANEAAIDEPVPTPSPTPGPADYAFASGAGVIGMSPEALESRLGPAESKAGGHWAYQVAGCSVSYTVRQDRVVAATLPVGATCHPVVNGLTVTEATTLGSLGGMYHADCVAQCRGPADPVLTLRARGATFTAVDAPLDAWAAALRGDDGAASDDGSDGEAPDPDRFTCVSDPPAAVAAQFAGLPVSSVTIGREPGPCRR